ncbi:GDYXXLXY domain-containing protein [Aeromonas crassostreae]
MRSLAILLCGLAILLGVNMGVWRVEHAIETGEPVLLRLAPVDPRSLMQGDYMRLNYELAREWAQAHPAPARGQHTLVIRLDRQGVARWQGDNEGAGLAPDERRLILTREEGQTRIGPDAYFFEEGQGDRFSAAAYGEFRLQQDGNVLLVALRDGDLRPLGPIRGRW